LARKLLQFQLLEMQHLEATPLSTWLSAVAVAVALTWVEVEVLEVILLAQSRLKLLLTLLS
jgi:hypothetical protein